MNIKTKIALYKAALVIPVFIIILIPLVTTSFSNEKVRLPEENRYTSLLPSITDEDGNLNTKVLTEFESWFDDHIGQRQLLTDLNGTLQYRLFDVFQPAQNVYSGKDGILNYFSPYTLAYHQHLNLRSDGEMQEIKDSFVYIFDWLAEQGIQFYYMQCYDKQSIYPEWMPDSVIQYGDLSRSGQVAQVVQETSIPFIDTKEVLLQAKEDGLQPYSRYADPCHWTERGAYLGYRQLMEEINIHNNDKFKVLTESDYDISIGNFGEEYYRWVQFTDMEEHLPIKNPKAVRKDEELPILNKPNSRLFENPRVGNDETVLILGDSYIRYFIVDDLAESFNKLVFFTFNEVPDFAEVVKTFNPQIVIFEGVERSDHMETIVKFANMLQEE